MSSLGYNAKQNTGTFIPKGACVVMVKTEWNAPIVDELEKGAKEVLLKHGVKHIHSLTVPGAVEIPFAIRQCWDKMKYLDVRPHAFIALGAVIKGDTPHFDYVNKIIAEGIARLNATLPVPSIFGVLTVDNEQQASDRIGGKNGHKGKEAADAAIKMIGLHNQVDEIIKETKASK